MSQACKASALRLGVQSLQQLFVVAPDGWILGGHFISFPVLLQRGLKLAFLSEGHAEGAVRLRVIALHPNCFAGWHRRSTLRVCASRPATRFASPAAFVQSPRDRRLFRGDQLIQRRERTFDGLLVGVVSCFSDVGPQRIQLRLGALKLRLNDGQPGFW